MNDMNDMNDTTPSHRTKPRQPVGSGGPLEVEVIFGSEETGGRFSLVRHTAAPHFGGPPVRHCHTRDGCWWYVLSGALELELASGKHRVEAGQGIGTGPGVEFLWRNPGGDPATFLCVYSPAGFERYFSEVMAAIAARAGDPLPEVMKSVIPPLWAKYGIEPR